eukprot:CAMPEP_0119106490 /NCGR_PEP_ID=MMETSP1180-20130426/4485_1 /TAXON_ID=3052 ORGANISM="Chlamydomonas cf sp, Strain CCMP681" /NCGR_SAMPLE_ID=MMETSP1180 /ASSEMBLY_ACC=CAM_ASM_000741 /LENGTH=249 /DNA_ID=CAMNT_0007091839 /DNA_START=27 /DNA_END=776 /DNA_ORIENTATION=-
MAQSRRYESSMATLDLEKGGAGDAAFADGIVRAGFIKKTFGLLCAQLALTTVLAGAIVFNAAVRAVVVEGSVIPLIAMFGSLGLILALSFSEHCRNSHPTNLILMAAFTVCESVIVGMAASRYDTMVVITAFGMTAAVSAGLAVYAQRTKNDFTAIGGFLHAMLMSLILATILAAVFHVPMLSLGISLGGAALFSLYLIHDIQMIVGGAHHQFKFGPDDYVIASIQCYLDIINLFLHLLRILSELNRNS